MRLTLLAPLLAGLLLAFACVPEEKVTTQDIVSAVPWPDQERAEYVLLDREGEEELGRGVLTVERKDGRFELGLHYVGAGETEGDTDDTTVLVDAATLKPVSLARTLVSEGERLAVEAEYDAVEGVVNITEISEDGRERLVPLRLKEHYYDNDSSLFLWRTIDFREDYQAKYHTVITGNRTQNVVSLRVTGKESVTVPAGTFDAWRVEIRAGDVRQVAWFADTPQRPLVQYDNSRQLFQLTGTGE